ncbi:hypothetical protein [Saccharopolyspora rosea]|uniref:Uncharacterized protein n=1 Tax=Saccharopolyspora rosea TaxID=524884 RepID=A0ABW3FN65_9PSEU|nr:hypothetical protein [Saccharopolyspora rosea]
MIKEQGAPATEAVRTAAAELFERTFSEVEVSHRSFLHLAWLSH